MGPDFTLRTPPGRLVSGSDFRYRYLVVAAAATDVLKATRDEKRRELTIPRQSLRSTLPALSNCSGHPCREPGGRPIGLAIAAKHRNDFAWRIVAEFVRDFGAWIAVIALAVGGVIPLWLGCLANGWIAYLMYMTLREATHGNISRPDGESCGFKNGSGTGPAL